MDQWLCESCVQAWSPEKFWLAVVVLSLVSLASFVFLWRFFRRARLIEDTPTSRLRSAAQGYVEVIGWGKEFEDGERLYAPLTRTPCLWYRYKVEEYQRRGNDRAKWKTIESGVSNYTFVVDDTTGRCVVDPEGAEVTATLKDVWLGAQRVPRNVDKHGHMAGGMLQAAAATLGAGNRYRFTEERIIKDEHLYVLGYLETVGGHRLSFDMRGTVRDLIAGWKEDYQQMLARFDIDGDGKIDMEEWKQVRQAALQEAHMLKDQAHAAPELNLVARPPGRQPFIISTGSEDDIVRRYRWYAGACLLAFLLSGAGAWFMFAARFGG